jgi:hypothetical protein
VAGSWAGEGVCLPFTRDAEQVRMSWYGINHCFDLKCLVSYTPGTENEYGVTLRTRVRWMEQDPL